MNTEFKHNYYEILEISENATQQEVLTAYERAKKTYSAENTALSSVFSQEEASELRNMIEEAYEILSNQTYRNIYEKRRLTNTFTEEDLSIQAIKTAGQDLFQRAIPPEITAEAAQITTDRPTLDPDFENELAAKKDWSGDDLRRVREYRKLSFDELTDITKVNPWYISAIEKMDPANLPVEVFVRGYVLQIAKALSLKEKLVTDSYMRLFRKKIEN